MINNLKKCFTLNLKLQKSSLQFQNFGNVSVRINKNYFVIKPSGINVSKSKYKYFPVVNIDNGKYSGDLRPSSDTPTHLEIYKKFTNIKSIVHTHSKYAVIWAQSNKDIPIVGTTHADYWPTNIPITQKLKRSEITNNYEANTGKKIVEKILKVKGGIKNCSGILVPNHGPFAWGNNFDEGLKNAERLEYIAELAYKTFLLNKKSKYKSNISNETLFKKTW